MTYEALIRKLRKDVEDIVGDKITITGVEFEGPVVVIQTKNMDEFVYDSNLVRKIAQGLKRRVAIRPHDSLVFGIEESVNAIKAIIPEEAKVTDIAFNHDSNEVTIEAISPGLAIGKHGANLNEIKKNTGWAPQVVRTPPIESRSVKDIRHFLKDPQVTEKRKEFLKKVGRRIFRDIPDDDNWVRTTSLGSYREVGRACHMLTTRNSKVLIDVGVNVGSHDHPSPYLQMSEVQPFESIDAVVLTHAHLDHSGLVPLLYKYGYDGPIYCTPPTRDLMALLALDYIKVAGAEGKRPPYDSENVREAILHTIVIKYNETTDIAPDVRLTMHNAGHILGSASPHFHIGDGLYNIVYSGDIKYERTWLFNAATNKFPRVEAVVMESTYGGKRDFQPTRKEAADQVRSVMQRTLSRGGKALVPVFAVGRSQEVMIVLEKQMKMGQIPKVPIYLDGMIWEATAIHTAYPEYLNNQLRTQIFQRNENPFLTDFFRKVDSREMREEIKNSPEPCIILATSGMLNGGPVMDYLKHMAPDPRNCLVFVGYMAEGTLGRKIQKGLTELIVQEKGKPMAIHLKASFETIDGFSGHSDRKQLINYISTMEPKPDRVVIHHGDEMKEMDFSSSLHRKYGMTTYAPMNLETIRFK
ncbi:MAG: beta-CASP ribonuclease aCPSF1 [Candidatus Thermoplasmatota archaeon]|nr:beta-CASP ribonuclease aCPSF1 [Candidatus Thermoplasmatota archaeon]